MSEQPSFQVDEKSRMSSETEQSATLKEQLVPEDSVKLESSWKKHLLGEFQKPYMRDLKSFLKTEMATSLVYPPAKNFFQALDTTPFEKVKVVILGQDPYHGPGQAHGLSFSVPPGVIVPPSLENIYKELYADLNIPPARHGFLKGWAREGVLLLNATLTVQARRAGSHRGKGWEEFTDKIIFLLNEKREHLVFLLWGSPARQKGAYIDRTRHCVLETVHPSPLSAHRGFFGCRHFSKANEYLKSHSITPINWAAHQQGI